MTSTLIIELVHFSDILTYFMCLNKLMNFSIIYCLTFISGCFQVVSENTKK